MAQASASRGKDWWWCGTLVEKVKSVYFFALDRDQGLGGGAVDPLPMAYRTALQMDTITALLCCYTASVYMGGGGSW